MGQSISTNQNSMGRERRRIHIALTSLMGLILSYAFVFLAALPIRYLRLTFGRKAFVMSSAMGFVVLAATQMWQWLAVYSSLCFLVGMYRELEEKKFSIFMASLITILSTSLANIMGFLLYSKWTGQSLKLLLVEKATPVYEQFKEMPRFKDMKMDSLIHYLPSGLIITLMVVVFVSLTVTQFPEAYQKRIQLRKFKLPDAMIWFFLAGLGMALLDTGSELISVAGNNLLFVTSAAYFFQGLAVFTYFLDRLRIFGFWRILAYFLVFFQLFVFVAGLGVLDFWFDFRNPNISNDKIKI